jgi:hypothetical protein
MTQDQYGQARDSGYGVHGQVVEDDETGEFQNDEDKPMTRFQKVASALRGDRSDQADQDEADLDQDGTVSSAPDPNGAALGRTAYDTNPDNTVPNSTFSNNTVPEQAAGPDARTGDYWDAQGTRETGQGPAEMTQPDMPPVAGVDAELPASEDEVDADPLTSRDEMDGDPLTTTDTLPDTTDTLPDTTGTLPDTTGTLPDTTGVPDAAAASVATGDTTSASTTGASTAGAGAREELHPGEAAGTLDDLGDLAYGKLLPDAADFTAQWQQIQYKFVDDPHASVTEAADVVAQVTAKLEAAIQERQRAMEARQRAIQEQQSSLRGRWGDDAQADTETLRETLRMYKAFLDQLVGPKA